MIVAFLFGLTSALAATPSALDPNTVLHEYDPNGVERIQVDNVVGQIRIRPMERNRFIARIAKKKFSDKCVLTIEKSTPQQILVRVDGPSYDECEADLDLQVPKSVDLAIHAGSGKVDVNDIEGRLSFRIGQGSIFANGAFKSVEGRSGSGPVSISGLEGSGKIDSANGPVSLKFNDDPKGDFELNSGTGDATVLIPKGLRIRADLMSGAGQITNEFTKASRADFGLNMKSGTGDITVKSY